MNPIEDYLRTMCEFKIRTMGAPRPGYYAGIEDFLIQKGRAYQSAPLTRRERQVVNEIRARGTYPIKQCFSNSQRVVLDQVFNPAPDDVRILYAEGYVLRHDLGIPIHHGWLDVNGKVVDLTLRRVGKVGPLLAVGEFAGADYFGATFPLSEVRNYALATQTYGSMLDDWKRGYPYMEIGYKP